MNYKNIFILLLILPVLLLSVPGCASSQEGGSIQTEPQEEGGIKPPIENIPAPPQESPPALPSITPSEAGLPITLKMSFPNGAPALNQDAQLSCQVNARVFPAKNMEVHVKLPEAFKLVEGNLSWVGDIAKGDEVEVINVTVKAVEVGNYAIEGTTTLNPDEHGAFGGSRHSIYVSISEDTAEWRNYPPYSDLTGQPGQMKAGPDVTEDYPEPPSAPPPQ